MSKKTVAIKNVDEEQSIRRGKAWKTTFFVYAYSSPYINRELVRRDLLNKLKLL